MYTIGKCIAIKKYFIIDKNMFIVLSLDIEDVIIYKYVCDMLSRTLILFYSTSLALASHHHIPEKKLLIHSREQSENIKRFMAKIVLYLKCNVRFSLPNHQGM